MSLLPFPALMRLFRAQAYIEARLEPELASIHGLSFKEFHLLAQLSRAPANRLRRVDLAGRLNVSQSTVTRMAVPLEKTGLVVREPDPRDARVAYMVLTPVGAERIQQAEVTVRRMAADVFRDRWTPAEINTLGDLLGRLTASLPGEIS